MGKYAAQAVFDRLAVAYIEAAGNTKEARDDVEALRREHDYALNVIYGVETTRNMKKALKNDLRGS